jgi:hypothetical protein
MRKLSVTLLAAAAILTMSAAAWKADAQVTRGATTALDQEQNFSPVRQTACGPFRGRWCGPYHHRVCGPAGRCWCAHC